MQILVGTVLVLSLSPNLRQYKLLLFKCEFKKKNIVQIFYELLFPINKNAKGGITELFRPGFSKT